MPSRFRAIVVYEGLATGDRRFIDVGALSTRALPLSLMGMTQTQMGHDGAEVVARIDTLTREDASAWVDESTGQTWGDVAGGSVFAWVAEGEFDDREQALDVEQLVRDLTLRGVSVDLAAVTSELEVLEVDDDGWPTDWLERVTEGEIAAATICSVPAFKGCTIELVDDQAAEGETRDVAEAIAASAAAELPAFRILAAGPGCEPCAADPARLAAVTASGGPVAPPQAWFADPGLDRPTPLTVGDDGRVYGHLAVWGTCHTGFSNQCVTPPRSATGYSLYRLGAVRTAEGTDVPVGQITIGTGHADLTLSAAAAASHYDNTGTVLVDVAMGEDAHGIWFAGALRPEVTEREVRQLRAAKLSGDWRRHGGNLELVAALAVNVPGFPVVRSVAASGVPQSLVAAGAQAVRAQAAPDQHQLLTTVLTEIQRDRRERQAAAALSRIRRTRP